MTSTPKPPIKPTRKELRDRIVQVATSYEGYQAASGSADIFSSKVGKPGAHWNGIYVDVVLMEAGLELPTTHVATAAALRYYMISGRLHTKPKPGDVAFFTFPTDGETGPYNQMHVGIVTGSENFLRDGSFKVIEGQIDPGLPKSGLRAKNGVHVRTRYATDVVGFGRPALKPKSLTDELQQPELLTKPVIKASIMKPGLKHRQVALLQQELRSEKLFTGTYTGILDARTMAAVASFQRTIGYVGSEASGVPDRQTLDRLAQIRQTFNVTD
jgi:hypothetical protein